MTNGQKHIAICSTSLAQYDRRILRISKTLSTEYKIKWLSRGSTEASWLHHTKIKPIVSKGFLFYATYNIQLFFKLLFIKCDVICAVDLDTVLPAFVVSKLRNKTLVFDAHEHFTEVPELQGRNLVKKVWRMVEKVCVNQIENNYTVGSALSKIFAERHGQEYEVIRNVPFLNSQNKKREHDGQTMVYLGMVNKGRGVELAIKAMLKLKNKKLKIIGSGDVEKEMKFLVDKFELNDRVEFLGFISPNEIAKQLESCWVAINMLDPISKSYYYSLANKFFDYLQAGLPTINMSFPEYESINKEFKTGYLAKEYTSDELVKGVMLLENKQYYSDCENGLSNAKALYCWEVEGQRLLDFYAKLA